VGGAGWGRARQPSLAGQQGFPVWTPREVPRCAAGTQGAAGEAAEAAAAEAVALRRSVADLTAARDAILLQAQAEEGRASSCGGLVGGRGGIFRRSVGAGTQYQRGKCQPFPRRSVVRESLN